MIKRFDKFSRSATFISHALPLVTPDFPLCAVPAAMAEKRQLDRLREQLGNLSAESLANLIREVNKV